jgi:hypothetical protein
MQRSVCDRIAHASSSRRAWVWKCERVVVPDRQGLVRETNLMGIRKLHCFGCWYSIIVHTKKRENKITVPAGLLARVHFHAMHCIHSPFPRTYNHSGILLVCSMRRYSVLQAWCRGTQQQRRLVLLPAAVRVGEEFLKKMIRSFSKKKKIREFLKKKKTLTWWIRRATCSRPPVPQADNTSTSSPPPHQSITRSIHTAVATSQSATKLLGAYLRTVLII